MNLQDFQQALKKHRPGTPVEAAETADAFRNLAGFIDVLIRVNERTGLVSLASSTGSVDAGDHSRHSEGDHRARQ